ncbi:TetR/AcrR family transcriptional regulator [Leptospira bouyouniensis]|uniref:TetR/AcrR family transcriptional regulator n=1 Tax=Leptospira bouyouniensis TaxID=2484911 RepID=A0A7I0II69_9LEPT|nr:TetR/AcrR family transcriptional regulator [Leptospira bouyouniensis]TGL02977.1 TetR/AcrR family transcriptional regulator [Leptospira bouyouniensis]
MAEKKKIQEKESAYHHGDLRSALIHAARTLLEKHGIESLSLRSIASAIGVTHMAPYAHFKGKQELLQAVAASGYDELANNMVMAQKENPKVRGRSLAYHYGLEYIRFAMTHPNLYRLMLNQIEFKKKSKPEPTNKEVAKSSERPFRLLYAAFASDRGSKDLAHAKALGAWAIVHGVSSLAIDNHLVLPEGMDIFQLFKVTVSSSVDLG